MKVTRRHLLAAFSALGYGRLRANRRELVRFGEYTHLVNASTNQKPDAPFRLAVATLRLGLNDTCRNRLSFKSSDPLATLPKPYAFGPGDDHLESHVFDVMLKTEGLHTVTVRDESTSQEFASNAILVARSESKYKLYFGDIHIHSAWSTDGRGAPADSYYYARDAMNLDFACLTEHDPTDEIWQKVKALAKDLYQPGKFATLSAYEWTGHRQKQGHKNVYYRDFEGPVFRSDFLADRPAEAKLAKDLWKLLRARGQKALTIPHHPASAAFPVPWEDYDPEYQRCVEIYSTWGSSEAVDSPRLIRPRNGPAPGHFAQDALEAGQKLGFVAASDSHSGRPGYPAHGRPYFDQKYYAWNGEAYTGGITGIYAEELTREAVFDAVYRRRCYAATGVRIILDFRADDHWMGEEYRSNDAPHLKISVVGTAALESVLIVKNGRPYFRIACSTNQLDYELTQTQPPRETDYYYVRVIQVDGEMAWSSPIWVTRK